MITFAVNEVGDLELDGQNNIKMIDGPDERIQSVRLLLGTNTGEWFLNTFHGLAMYEILGQKQINEDAIRAVVLEALEQETRIEEILSLDVTFDNRNRNMTIRFSVRMDGQVVNGEEVI